MSAVASAPATRSRRRNTAVPSRLLAGPGNRKLGRDIHSWSIPAIHTCPGSTARCRRLCYAASGMFRMPSIADRHAANLAESLKADFAERMIAEIHRDRPGVVRVHVAGDFYDHTDFAAAPTYEDGPADHYVQKWRAVFEACPDTRFFVYTRSWRVPDLVGPLTRFAELPHVQLWWSEDRQTGPSPRVPGVRTCFMLVDAFDDSLVGPHVDLVFREDEHRRAVPHRVKRVSGVLVCPHEQAPYGTEPAAAKLTCSNCRICWRSYPHSKREQPCPPTPTPFTPSSDASSVSTPRRRRRAAPPAPPRP